MPQADAGRKPRRQWAPDARALNIVGDRWLMVIVRDLAAGPLRLEALRRWLPGVSAGALEARLARMADEGLLVRRRHRSLPPRVDLELTEQGRALATVIGELARWELRTHWSRPHEDEWVDVAACFRLAPFLDPLDAVQEDDEGEDAEPPVDGELLLTILGSADADPDHWTFSREDGHAHVEHSPTTTADAELSGTHEAWIQALSPGGKGKLKMAGDERFAESFLRLFAAA
jgi:DNA-binding HxlR family transcriptional regulator